MKLLVVVDMQNDFIDGALGSAQAQAVVEPVWKKIELWRAQGGQVIFTRDTHDEHYMQSQEGRKLPVEHCIKGTHGWQICDRLTVGDSLVVDKPTFGSVELAHRVAKMEGVEEVQLVGVCTDICVISNAMVLKAAMPEMPISVSAGCCAGVTQESHETALQAMAACQIEIVE